MAFTLTKYIYPIEREIFLSSSLGYSIDNPRTEQEIQFVKNYIKPSLSRLYENSKPDYNPMLSLSLAVGKLKDYSKGRNEYLYNYLQENYQTDMVDILSQSWIILRYNDNGEFDKAEKDLGAFFDIFFSDDRKAYISTYNNLLSYFQLISLLIHDDEDRYSGDSLILLKRPQDIFYPIERYHEVTETFNSFMGECNIIGKNRQNTWDFYPDIEEKILSATSRLEPFMLQIVDDAKSPTSKNIRKLKKKRSGRESLLYIGNLLRIVENDTLDLKVKLLLLVSIIEYLVTRNPDTTRFNVEDSISKQFVLKTSILIYAHNNEQNLNEIKKNLKLIYGQRSNVAHGNYISEHEEEDILLSFYRLYDYIRSIIYEYLKDPTFVDYLKEN